MMRTARRRFANRRQAGRELASVLVRRDLEQPVVLGIPAGGVVVAAEVAKTLGADLGVIVTRKLEAPYQPELTLGAVTADNVSWVHDHVAEEVGASEGYVWAEIVRRAKEARRIERDFGSLARPPIHQRTVIIVDDGVVTGARALAALRSVTGTGARKAILATATGSPEALGRVRAEGFEAMSIEEDPHFISVGDYFVNFCPVTRLDVQQLLETASHLFSDTPPARPLPAG